MEEQFNNLINKMKEEKMTKEEKASIYFRVETFINNNPIQAKQPSPYFSKFHFATAGKVFATGLLLMTLGVGGLSYSSASALPGDLLYPVKLNIKEKIEEQLIFSPIKKIALRQKRIETRFTEVESLIKENKITPENNAVVKEAEKNINSEKQKLQNDLVEVQTANPEVAMTAKISLENSVKDHQEIIANLIEQKTEENSNNNETNENFNIITNTENIDNNSKNTENSNIEQIQTITVENTNTAEEIPEIKTTTEAKTEETSSNQNLNPTINTSEIQQDNSSLLIQDIKIIPNTNDVLLLPKKINDSTANSKKSE